MVNQEHLEILKQGVDAWNKWREEHRSVQPDLSGAQLINTDLSGANLSRAKLFTTVALSNLSNNL